MSMQKSAALYHTHHRFHIPVMGTGFTIDTALRVGRFGISSVMSLVDDLLVERIRKHYSKKYDIFFEAVHASHPDARAARFTAYINFVQDILDKQIEEIKAL